MQDVSPDCANFPLFNVRYCAAMQVASPPNGDSMHRSIPASFCAPPRPLPRQPFARHFNPRFFPTYPQCKPMELQPKVDNWVRFAKNLSHGSRLPRANRIPNPRCSRLTHNVSPWNYNQKSIIGFVLQKTCLTVPRLPRARPANHTTPTRFFSRIRKRIEPSVMIKEKR